MMCVVWVSLDSPCSGLSAVPRFVFLFSSPSQVSFPFLALSLSSPFGTPSANVDTLQVVPEALDTSLVIFGFFLFPYSPNC